MAKQGDQADRIKKLVASILESQVKKSVKDKVLALSQKSNDKWAGLLHDILRLKEALAPECDVDVYSMFIRSLLDNKVTQSIEQLIKSDVVPADELQTSVLRYLQDRYNQCEDDKFYKLG